MLNAIIFLRYFLGKPDQSVDDTLIFLTTINTCQYIPQTSDKILSHLFVYIYMCVLNAQKGWPSRATVPGITFTQVVGQEPTVLAVVAIVALFFLHLRSKPAQEKCG